MAEQGTQMSSAENPTPAVGGMQETTTNLDEAPSQQVQPSEQQRGKKRKPSRPAASGWSHFRIEGDLAFCNYCGKQYACNSISHGTTNLNKHLKNCLKNPHREIDNNQKTIALGSQSEGDSVSMKLVEFSQEKCRIELAKMIVIDELPFKFVENVGFRNWCGYSVPRFRIPSRKTVARDVMQLFVEEKTKLKSMLSLNQQMVSLTTDTWTSIQNMNYMCVTAHYIDEGWELHKRILSFGLVADHKGETIDKTLEKCLKDWGIVKVGTVTVDNASANNTALTYLVRSMGHWNGSTFLSGQYLQMRCCAHILNLIVGDGMKDLDCSIGRIRASCKYVRSSPARLASFKKCAEDANLSTNQMVVLDVPTRWNSTYMMLDVAEKFEKAFNRLEFDDPSFSIALVSEGGPPNWDDWSRARHFIQFLKIFYDVTLTFSASLHVTANTFVHQLFLILTTLREWMKSHDLGIQRMAANMKGKFDKYWDIDGSLNYLLFVAVFLDPRYKWKYIELCLGELYDHDKCIEVQMKLRDLINKLFAQYGVMYPLPNSSTTSGLDVTSQSQGGSGGGQHVDRGNPAQAIKDKLKLRARIKQGEFKKNELDRYINDDLEEDKEEFDILKWWKGKTSKYHILSCMARDILAIPMSTVSSEAAFSIGGRVLDPYRSSLSPITVEALICTQNWLMPSKVIGDSKSQSNEVEGEIESELSTITGYENAEVRSILQNL